MERWTRLMLRYRWVVVAIWAVILLAGGYASSKLPDLLTNTFTMPGTDSERARAILEEHFGDRSDGAFTIVFTRPGCVRPAQRAQLQAAMAKAAEQVPSGEARPLVQAQRPRSHGDIVSTLDLADAKGYTDEIREQLPKSPSACTRTSPARPRSSTTSTRSSTRT